MKHWTLFLIMVFLFSSTAFAQNGGDTLVIQTFSFDDPSPEGWGAPYRGTFTFPDDDRSWEQILMIRSPRLEIATKT
ncbi:MAG: hypothetical protein KAR09_07605 [Bacteroidales bacterium]|nr:hypothetical protein [Bacteroidales bacterium]